MFVQFSFASLLIFFFAFILYRFSSGRQSKQPIPPGDSTFFYHGQCVATSAIIMVLLSMNHSIHLIASSLFTVSSHSCKLKSCFTILFHFLFKSSKGLKELFVDIVLQQSVVLYDWSNFNCYHSCFGFSWLDPLGCSYSLTLLC